MGRREVAVQALAADTIDGKLAAIMRLANWVGTSGVDNGVLSSATAQSASFARPPCSAVVSSFAVASSAPTGEICATAIVRGIPQRPLRVEPHELAPRSNLTTVAGRAALIHAVAHIEYSAIDLALDHALRFSGMPVRYYDDWIRVAVDEARHFELLRTHLQSCGHDYGDFPVHDGLWEMAEKTAHDCLTRMALVPRLLEARGLDATPPIQKKLAAAGDAKAVAILAVILADEEDHVAIGDYWYRFLCVEQGLEPEVSFRRLIREYKAPWPQAPMNTKARLAAGFAQLELDELARGARVR